MARSIERIGNMLSKDFAVAFRDVVKAINHCVSISPMIHNILDCIESIENPDLRNLTKQVFITQYAPRLGFINVDWETLRKITRNPYAMLSFLYNQYLTQPILLPRPQTQTQTQAKAIKV
jgi:hypothetical protein